MKRGEKFFRLSGSVDGEVGKKAFSVFRSLFALVADSACCFPLKNKL
jgi:hypothetical protein